MSTFLPFEPNPFLVNAFTITGVPVDVVKSIDIQDLVKARADEIDHDGSVCIPSGLGKTYLVTTADLTAREELLRDPNRRPREELLVPAKHPIGDIEGVKEFQTRHKLTRSAADSLLRFDPLDATHLLVAGLPEVPCQHLIVENPSAPERPKLPRSPLKLELMLVKARDSSGKNG